MQSHWVFSDFPSTVNAMARGRLGEEAEWESPGHNLPDTLTSSSSSPPPNHPTWLHPGTLINDPDTGSQAHVLGPYYLEDDTQRLCLLEAQHGMGRARALC